MKPMARWLVIMPLVLIMASGVAISGETEEQAVKIAEEWLALVDQGKYEESWQEAASLAKTVVTAEQWSQAIEGARKPLGDLNSRKLKSAKYTTTMPGAPDGEYVVIQFDTSFANKKKAIETLIPMKGEDGVWRVSGYFIN
jgi:hypothetical protein